MEAALAILSALTLLTSAERSPQAAAKVYLAPGGSDSNVCTRAEPCASFSRGYRVARPGGTVILQGGSYPAQTLRADPGKGTGAVVTFRPSPGAAVSLRGRLWLDGARDLVISQLRLRTADPYWDLLVDACTKNVTFRGVVGRRFHINEGTDGVRFIGGTWGDYGRPGEDDSSIGTNGAGGPTRSCDGALAKPSRNIVFNGVTFRDVFWNVPRREWGGAHPDCFEINGYVERVTIRNSRFLRCGDSFFAIYTDQGDSKNITVTHSTFMGLGNYAYYGIQMGNSRHSCGNIVFRNNVYWPDNPESVGYPYSAIHTTCEADAGTSPTRVTENLFQRGPRPENCGTYLRRPFETVWTQNLFPGGARCGSTARVPFGYRITDGRVIAGRHAPIVRRIFSAAARGSSPKSIARLLGRAGGRWSANRVRRVIGDDDYLGGRYGSRGFHRALVSRGLWRRAQRAL